MMQNGSGIFRFAQRSDQNSPFSVFPRFANKKPEPWDQGPKASWLLVSEPGSIFWSKKRFFYWYLSSWDLSRSIRLEKWCRTVVEFFDLLNGATKTAHFRFFPGSLTRSQPIWVLDRKRALKNWNFENVRKRSELIGNRWKLILTL